MRVSLSAFSALLLFISSCSVFRAPSKEEVKSESAKINDFFEREFEKKVERYPTWQTYLGRKTNYGKLDNETEEFALEDLELEKKSLAALKRFNYDLLDESSKLSYDLYKYQLEKSIANWKWRYHYFPLNQMFGYQAETPSFLINMHRIQSEQDAKDYISRLKEIKRVFGERMAHLKKQEKKGVFPPDFVFPKILDDSQNILAGQPFTKGSKDSPLLKDFKSKLDKLELGSKKKRQLILHARQALKEYVEPAYQELVSYVKRLDSKTDENKGAWSLPEGAEYYNHRLKNITTTDMSADEIHQKGLDEVERIHGEMRSIMKKTGFEGGLKDFFAFMKSDIFLYPQSKKGRSAYLQDAKKLIADIKKELPKLFNVLPKADLEVKAVEPYREKSAGIAFYNGPSLEGNRPGIYYVNLYKMEDNPKYKMEALAYHEALPGHHMQIAIAKELESLPTFRRTGGYTAYVEGWGLYSELLPKEIGFYQDPYSDFGRLSMELWRATRMVVDTGIHAKKWSREKAIAYLSENTPNSELEIVKGVERYFVMPGQATAYKVGMLKILELRERARKELGGKFDIRSFHDVILKDGALPLFILEEKVDQWIEEVSQKG